MGKSHKIQWKVKISRCKFRILWKNKWITRCKLGEISQNGV